MAEEKKVEEQKIEQPAPKKNHRKAKIGWSIVGGVVLTIVAGTVIAIIAGKTSRYNSSEVKLISDQKFVCEKGEIIVTKVNEGRVTDDDKSEAIIKEIAKLIADDKKDNPNWGDNHRTVAVYEEFDLYLAQMSKFDGSYIQTGTTSWQKFSSVDYTLCNSNNQTGYKGTAETRSGEVPSDAFSFGCNLENFGDIECMRATYSHDEGEDPHICLYHYLGSSVGLSNVRWSCKDGDYILHYEANYYIQK